MFSEFYNNRKKCKKENDQLQSLVSSFLPFDHLIGQALMVPFYVFIQGHIASE